MLAVLGFDAQFLRAFKIRAALDDGHVAHFCQRRDAVAQFVEHGFLPRPQLGQLKRRLGKRDAAMRRFARVDDLVRRVKQRLRRDAAAIQAHAAEMFVAFDENDFLAEVSGVKRRGITARTGADNYDFSFDRIHVLKFFVREFR